jgi:hypothetical protein
VLHESWEAFLEGDATHSHLFPNRDPKTLKFVVFQQAVIKSQISTISEDELRRVEEYIEKRFTEDTEIYENPWKALKVDETQTDADLERQYTAR